jgi:penicillin-binding protein 1A
MGDEPAPAPTPASGSRVRARLATRPWRRIGIGAALVALAVAVVPPLRSAAAGAVSRAVVVVASPLAPDVGGFGNLPQPTRILAADGTAVAELDGGERREQVRVGDLPPHVPRAVLAAEGARFYHHHGVDPEALLREVTRNALEEK